MAMKKPHIGDIKHNAAVITTLMLVVWSYEWYCSYKSLVSLHIIYIGTITTLHSLFSH